MDSGTSGGSMQSGSSGDDDQNDTNSFPTGGVSSIPRLHQQDLHLPQTHLHQPIFSSQYIHHYPPLTNTRDINTMSGYSPNPNTSSHLPPNNSYLETLPQSDLDRIWSMSMNVHPESHNHNQQRQQQQMFYSSTSTLAPSSSAINNPNIQTLQDPLLKPPGKIPSLATQPSKENGSSSGRAVKKRTRASRKTPTTVLTTDTTNFRAMVQEFTGIPTPPFGPSSLFPSKKFDLFGNTSGLDHPSLGSLLFSLNKSTNNSIPNPNPYAPPLITTTSQIDPFAREGNQSSNPNPYHQQQQQQHSQQMMFPQGSNSSYINLAQGDQIKNNPNPAFHHHQSSTQHSTFPSKYSNSGKESDQLGAFSNVERGSENDNISRTS